MTQEYEVIYDRPTWRSDMLHTVIENRRYDTPEQHIAAVRQYEEFVFEQEPKAILEIVK